MLKHVEFTADGQSILGTSARLFLELEASTLEVRRSIELEQILGTTDVQDLKTSPSGKHLGIIGRASDRRTTAVKILGIASLAEVQSIDPQKTARQLAFPPDGFSLALGFMDGSVGIWDIQHPEQPRWVETLHAGEVFALAFSPDGTRLFSAGRDAGIRLWDTRNGTSFGPLRGHSNYIYSLDICGDGKRLVSGSGDHTVRIWETWPYGRRAEAMGIAAPTSP